MSKKRSDLRKRRAISKMEIASTTSLASKLLHKTLKRKSKRRKSSTRHNGSISLTVSLTSEAWSKNSKGSPTRLLTWQMRTLVTTQESKTMRPKQLLKPSEVQIKLNVQHLRSCRTSKTQTVRSKECIPIRRGRQHRTAPSSLLKYLPSMGSKVQGALRLEFQVVAPLTLPSQFQSCLARMNHGRKDKK